MQRVHPDWLVFHNSATGLWSAYRRVLLHGGVALVRADSAKELDRKLTALGRTAAEMPPTIRAVAVARALQAAWTSHTARTRQPVRTSRAVRAGQGTALRRLLRP
ncbi:hypothetical protein ACFQ08_06035 [Streptosporangium algeriense]|uniref:Uncharacterized protein n=1 Tax=Streptosporangium algeriense TaxID=1682748 RepID=A0ABW3DJQ4_9ACTN